MTLPYDYARCAGDFPREECRDCLRRTSPGRPEWQSWMAPHNGPGPCPNRIGETNGS